MSSVLTTTQNECTKCAKLTTLYCSRCVGAPASTDLIQRETTYYCSKACQRNDWPDHKLHCKSSTLRRSLCRVGDTVQKALYLFREQVFEATIEKIERATDTITIYQGLTKRKPEMPLPTDIFRNEQEKQSILVFQSCDGPLIYIDKLLKVLLEEYEFEFKNKALQIKATDSIGRVHDYDRCVHVVLKVLLKNGEEYALDLTGAQYGYFETVIPFNEYKQSRVGTGVIRENMVFGARKRIYTDVKKTCISNGNDITLLLTYEKFAAAFNQAVRDWQKDNNLELSDMLKLPEEGFVEMQEHFLSDVKKRLGEFAVKRDETSFHISGNTDNKEEPEMDTSFLPQIAELLSRYGIVHSNDDPETSNNIGITP
ncbi:MAG: hypothetical protein M1834_009633 [Cirrosporium novae-zelandiae]|nr:MAG: hypothetical protein M1834_009633 [Cirrosporium novae-zelandiae]